MDQIQIFEKEETTKRIYHKLKSQWIDDFDTIVKVNFSYEKRSLIVDFDIFENEIRKCSTHNNDRVYEDSCVECFIQIPNSDEYYNFEISASSHMLVGRGSSRNNRRLVDESIIEKIDREIIILDETKKSSHWKLNMSLDLDQWKLIGSNENIKNYKIKANFYKCGDKLASPHYFALFDVDSEMPNFHYPPSFNELIFV